MTAAIPHIAPEDADESVEYSAEIPDLARSKRWRVAAPFVT
jgi:hypothetical protein